MTRKKITILGFILVLLIPFAARSEIIGKWQFQGNANDNAGSNNGKLIGSPVFVEDRFGISNNALRLNGIDQYVDVGNDAVLNFWGDGKKDKAFTLEWWQKSNTKPALGTPDGRAVGLFKKGREFFVGWENTFRIRMAQDSGAFIGKYSVGLKVKKGKWTNIVITYDGSGKSKGIKIYQDGKLMPSVVEEKGNYIASQANYDHFLIGIIGAKSLFNGVIDDVVIHDNVLTLNEIENKYKSKDESTEFQLTTKKPLIDKNHSDPKQK